MQSAVTYMKADKMKKTLSYHVEFAEKPHHIKRSVFSSLLNYILLHCEYFQLNVNNLLHESSFYFTIVAHWELHYIFLSVSKKKKKLKKGKRNTNLLLIFIVCVYIYVCERVLAVLLTEVWWWLKRECFPIGYECCYFHLWEEGLDRKSVV